MLTADTGDIRKQPKFKFLVKNLKLCTDSDKYNLNASFRTSEKRRLKLTKMHKIILQQTWHSYHT